MQASSRIVQTLSEGLVLNVQIEDLSFVAYVVVSEPDLNLVAKFVPAEQFDHDNDVHVTAVSSPEEAAQQVEDLAFNMNLDDIAVFLCHDNSTYLATLEHLGQDPAVAHGAA